ncbi:hypothetical protein HDU76_013913 [Blyttiomyces sp. JEL0837]|nr:hypothetical protein HDU76_013913 [Blyttiomyces sp. JEL0837]
MASSSVMRSTVKVISAITALTLARVAYNLLRAYFNARRIKKLNPDLKVYTMPLDSDMVSQLYSRFFPHWMIPLRRGWMRTLGFSPFIDSPHNTLAWSGPGKTTVVVADATLAHDAMMRWKEFPKPAQFYRLLGMFGKNVVATEGEDWRRHRKVISSQFGDDTHSRVVVETIDGCHEMVEMWNADIKAKGLSDTDSFEVNVSADMTSLTLNVLCNAALGMKTKLKFAETVPPGHEVSFQYAVQHIFNVGYLGAKMILPDFIVNSLPIASFKRTQLAIKETEQYLTEILENARASEEGGKNILRLLVHATDSVDPPILSDRELRSNALIFILAGHDTTAGTLANALALLAYNEEAQDKVYEEAKSILGSVGDLTYKDISKFKYIMAVMNETLRMYSLVTSVPKWTADSEQQLGPLTIPPKTTVLIHIHAMHYNPNVWGPDVNQFRPERFLNEDGAHLLTMIAPFSEGPRACIGKKFAIAEFISVLSFLSLRYTFKPIPGIKREDALRVQLGGILTKPVKPIRVIFTPRF